ncbi:uncharacterized protein LOC124544261 [Vanessa cardui]|uniref:uncharacterized protein LOC124544261 n=1 Tax=Vanessa cardui TaxID=171605 RepID=UPI001F139FFB|nr:uncharacterized protein LOC124544261 [Vanessa cardui]
MNKPKKQLNLKIKKDGDFIPPDGGWGWMIVIAAGFSNLSTLPMLQQFGLLFRDKFSRLGISSSETTTIINMNAALTSCVGLANGPVFKIFSYRQVSLTGTIVVFIALVLTAFSYNFITYLICFSVLYGAGYGISSSANALALNTYWRNRRRLATGLSWTTTGLGPIVWPHIITALFASFGETGTILIISGFALHSVACALLLQPVEWHSKSPDSKDQDEERLITPNPQTDNLTNDKNVEESGYFSQVSKIKNLSLFSSQYLYNEDDPVTPGYEITDPGVPMMLRANDGYFSQSRQSRSKLSSREGSAKTSRLNSKKPSMSNLLENRSRKSSTLYLNESKKNSSANLGALMQDRESKQTNKPKRKTSITLNTQIEESEIEDCPTLKAPQDLKADEKAVVEKIDPEKAKYIADRAEKHLAGTKSLKSFKMDGQYSEKYHKDNHSNISLKNQNESEERKYLKDNHSNQSYRTKHRRKSNNFNYESEVLKQASLKLEQYLKESEDDYQSNKFKLFVNSPSEDDVFEQKDELKKEDQEAEDLELTFCQKVAMFFDLDLLKDFTFINLMLGITLANFNELNFSILTPFILGDYGMTKPQVAFFMSLLAGVDICVRFCIPFVAGKIGWDNNSFFLFGVLSMAMGRVVLAYCQDYSVVLMVAIIIGFGKGLRTVFMALVIPTHVPLHKLPGATGIQLLTAGIVYLTLGPVVGWIKDGASTTVILHCLNIFTWLTAISWGTEKYFIARKQKIEATSIKALFEKCDGFPPGITFVEMSRAMNKVPPDGGYGWVVTFAYALNNVVVLPLIVGFGLVFQEAFEETGLTATQGSLVIVLNHGIGMLLSFFGGPVLSRFGYRKVALIGALLVSSGLILTAVATNFWLFIISYSIINSMGVAAVMAAFSLAINSYFKEKRGRAVGIGMSITGLGAIFMPLLMSVLIYTYGWRYAVLILSAICLHSLLAACLLRPAKWYLKDPQISEEMVPLNKDLSIELVNGSFTTSSKQGINSLAKLDESIENGLPPPKSVSMRALSGSNGIINRNAISHPDIRKETSETPLAESKYKWWESQEINLGSSINIFNETEYDKKEKELTKELPEEEKSKGIVQKIIDFFDLTLLKDAIFINILIGLSLASCVETNFSLLLPIILKDMLNFETSDIAKIMAVIGFSDTLFRLVSAFIGEWCHRPPRVMYLVCLIIIIFTRTIMLFTTTFSGMLFVAFLMGVTKGIRTVYMNIIIPSYVPLERLPFASGIQMLCNGIVITTIGSLLGRFRDLSGSYRMPIMILNFVTFLTVILWSAEFIYFRIKNKNNEQISE